MRERAVVVLRYFADLTEQETASELGISLGTVKSTVLSMNAKGDFVDPRHAMYQFHTGEVQVSSEQVLAIGVFAHTAARITIADADGTTDAQTRVDASTGMTMFWALRSAPPPPSADEPEQVTLTAYGANGKLLRSAAGVVFAANPVENPIDSAVFNTPS